MQLIINAKTRSICVNKNAFKKVPENVIDLLLVFQRYKHRVRKDVFYNVLREQRKRGRWQYIQMDVPHQKASVNTRIFYAHKTLYKYGLMVVSKRGYWVLTEITLDHFFNSQEATPQVYTVHGMKVWTFKNGIDFEKREYYLGTMLTKNKVLKTEIYVDERGIKHKYFNTEKVKELARELELQGIATHGHRMRELILIMKYLTKNGCI